MSDASPQDLAVSFRSIARRRREAVGDGPPDSPMLDEVDRLVAEAARLVGTTADPAFVADAIAAVPADQWDPSVLASLRAAATDIGRHLRDVAAQRSDDDD
jgi:hypothetical protein